MKDHIQVTFTDILPEQQEWMIAHLAEAGYEGFEQGDRELKAYIPEDLYDRILLREMAYKYQLEYNEEKIKARNWNAEWESGFQPVVVDDFVAVRANFHEPVKGVQFDIVITPKMSFGTGHHATTFLMLQQMKALGFTDKSVLDFGTGTGVLAILAEKLGAGRILAIDHDDWSIENARENTERNNCHHIRIKQAGDARAAEAFDIILANINKNVILDNFPVMAGQLKPGGIVLLSGLLADDETEILTAARRQKLVFAGKSVKDNWLCLKFVHES